MLELMDFHNLGTNHFWNEWGMLISNKQTNPKTRSSNNEKRNSFQYLVKIWRNCLHQMISVLKDIYLLPVYRTISSSNACRRSGPLPFLQILLKSVCIIMWCLGTVLLLVLPDPYHKASGTTFLEKNSST